MKTKTVGEYYIIINLCKQWGIHMENRKTELDIQGLMSTYSNTSVHFGVILVLKKVLVLVFI